MCSNLLFELNNLRSSNNKDQTKHKEEGDGRIKADQIDRKKLQNNLEKCIHSLQVDTHKNWNTLVNIYTGEEVGEDVNVNKAVEIGQKQMKEFCSSLPQGFRDRLSTKVVTMAESKKTKQISVVAPFNTELIFSRVLYLMGNNQLDFTTLFNYELCPVPTSTFHDPGEARYPKSKVVLKSRLKVEVSVRGVEVDAAVVDGGGMLHSSIHWPKDGSAKDLAKGVEMYVSRLLQHSDVCVIFDHYFDKSIKSETRFQRIGNFKRSHQLSVETSLPSKELCMSSLKTKENLIDIITQFLLQQFSTANCQHKLIVTSKSIYPVETSHGLQIKRQDLMTMFDEADYIIPQQVNTAIEQGQTAVKVISADTDVFVLLRGMYVKKNWAAAEVYMEDFNTLIHYMEASTEVCGRC